MKYNSADEDDTGIGLCGWVLTSLSLGLDNHDDHDEEDDVDHECASPRAGQTAKSACYAHFSFFTAHSLPLIVLNDELWASYL